MIVEVVGKCVTGKHHDVQFNLRGDGENGYSMMNGRNPLLNHVDKIREINLCILREHTDLAYIKPGQVRFLGSENFWIRLEARD